MTNAETIDDKTLIEMIRNDDEDAFRVLSSLYGNDIYLKAKSITKNNEDAEELTQDTMLKIRKGIFSFRGDSSLKTWIFRIISNLSINRLKKTRRQGGSITMSLDAPVSSDDTADNAASFADVLPSSEVSPADLIERSDTEAIMARAMAALPPEYAKIMDLRVAQELSYEEIAEKLNLTLGTVKSRIARARECLRQNLEKML